jgi:catechol 2,3-dioxygenase-like lactoylglutathione lyase family enzyme
MTVSLKGIGAITLFVEDLERSRSFYQDVFGLQAISEDEDSAAFNFGNTIINLLRIPAARTLIEPGVVASREAGSRFQLTSWLDDANAACAALDARGVEGSAHGLLHRPRRQYLGDRTGLSRAEGS